MLRNLSLLALLVISCVLCAQSTVNYLPSAEDFSNPERGFYRYTETRSGSYTPLIQSELEGYRNAYTSGGATYSIVSTLAFRYFFLEDFKAGPISQTYLDLVAADFATARAAGIKLLPRFAYTDDVNGDGCTSFICPPYGDAPKSIVLQHIGQLAPVLEEHKDVIAAVQMGLVGVWGENYYTDFFGDASPEGNGKLLDADWQNRNEVVAALLAAVPTERMVQVRYPQLKQRFIYGISAPTSSAALTAAEAYTGSDKARIGLHNDCLLASADDFGTFSDYGNTATQAGSDTAALKPYFAADSRYVVVGGETCFDGYNPQSDCSSSDAQAFGDAELRRMHYSYLNTDFNQDVNNDWQSGGCMDDIKRSLGYRFALTEGTYPTAASVGSALPVSITLENKGYAAPFNERTVELVLRETTSGELWRAELSDDPRTWQPEAGQIVLSAAPCLPDGMPTGTYELLFHLPDPMPDIYGRADYSIRLASLLPDGTDGWEPLTGFNQLGQEITVTEGVEGCASSVSFAPDNLALPLRLLSFTALQAGKSVRLEWTSREETNLAYHELLRGDDGRNFHPITRETALNAGAALTTYSFIDDNLVASGWVYYQLRSVDFDGTVYRSSVIKVRVESPGATELLITPNPSSGRVSLQWRGDAPEDADVMLFDLLGKQVLTLPLTSELNLDHLRPGTYSVIVRNAKAQWFQRIVVK